MVSSGHPRESGLAGWVRPLALIAAMGIGGWAVAGSGTLPEVVRAYEGKVVGWPVVDATGVTAYVTLVGYTEPLPDDAFRVHEVTADGRSWDITPTVTTVAEDRRRVNAAVTMDYSDSMGDPAIAAMQKATATLVAVMRPSIDTVSLVKFGTKARLVFPQGWDLEEARLAVGAKPRVKGTCTSFYDAVWVALSQVESTPDLRGVVAMTDGKDNCSRSHTGLDAIREARRLQVPVFTVGYGPQADEVMLRQIARDTGGLYAAAPDGATLASTYVAVMQLMQGAYVLRWRTSAPPGTPVEASVEITVPGADKAKRGVLPYVSGVERDLSQEHFDEMMKVIEGHR